MAEQEAVRGEVLGWVAEEAVMEQLRRPAPVEGTDPAESS